MLFVFLNLRSFEPSFFSRTPSNTTLLFPPQVDLEHQREVTASEGMNLSRQWNCPFIEASAKNRCGVNEMFAEIVREMNVNPSKKEANYCCCVLL